MTNDQVKQLQTLTDDVYSAAADLSSAEASTAAKTDALTVAQRALDVATSLEAAQREALQAAADQLNSFAANTLGLKVRVVEPTETTTTSTSTSTTSTTADPSIVNPSQPPVTQ